MGSIVIISLCIGSRILIFYPAVSHDNNNNNNNKITLLKLGSAYSEVSKDILFM